MLQFNMNLETDTYVQGGPIPVKLILTNTGTAPLLINGRLALNSPTAPQPYRDVSFSVTDPAGTTVYFGARVNVGRPEARHFKELGPGESAERTYDLKGYYRLDVPGKYSIQATYQNQSDAGNGREPWKGELKSSVANFTLVSK